MELAYVLANLKLVERNRDWLKADIPWSEKLRYYPAMVRSYARIVRGGPSTVDYLGAPFAFDNPATPLNLQTYPSELTRKIKPAIDQPKRILDVGGNIGQFSRTAHYLWPDAEIDVFEPNPDAFALLQKNTAGISQITCHNMAIGPLETKSFFFEKGRTGTGSFLEANVGALETTTAITVEVTDDPTSVTGHDAYDLIKVDVEGYEMTVIEHLGAVRCDCLYLEGSLGRSKTYTHDQLFQQIVDSFGSFELTYLSEVVPTMGTFEATMRFPDAG